MALEKAAEACDLLVEGLAFELKAYIGFRVWGFRFGVLGLRS